MSEADRCPVPVFYLEPRHDLCFDRKRPCFGSKTGVNQVLGMYILSGVRSVLFWWHHQAAIIGGGFADVSKEQGKGNQGMSWDQGTSESLLDSKKKTPSK